MPSKNYSRKAIYVITNRSRRDNTSKNQSRKKKHDLVEIWTQRQIKTKELIKWNERRYDLKKKKKETLPQWSQVYSLHISNVQASHPVRTASGNDSPWKNIFTFTF